MYVRDVSARVELRRRFSEPRTTSLPYNNALVRGGAWWCGVKRVDSLFLPLIRDLGIEDGMRLAEIKKDWYNLFNEPLSSHMSPCKLSGGEILLNIDSPVWLQELNFYKEAIIKKLSPYSVRDVRFRLSRVSTKEMSNVKCQMSNVKPLTTEERSYIEKTVSQISDEALRETVRRTIGKALISRRTKQ
ncbi:MAG: DUF721 domain-containing protein [Thermodesulfovibrionales bacterium]|nr:DUF721 domain-containing protein [Thermodesulfovibrionales bacterium]